MNKRDTEPNRLFRQAALAGGPPPRVINVDGHPAYPSAIAELKQSGELGRPNSAAVVVVEHRPT